MEKNQNNKRAVVLVSGGIDSVTTLAIASSEGFDVYAISFDYGQRHGVELEYASIAAQRHKSARHLVIQINMRDIGGSALTDDIEVPKGRRQKAEGRRKKEEGGWEEEIPVTYVPARNTIFLSFALAWAETLMASEIFIGANAVDYSGYPDCRPEFLRAYEDMANLATKSSVEGKLKFHIRAPLIDLSKSEIIKRGLKLGVDYSRTWSCYDPLEASTKEGGTGISMYKPCLQCDSCLLRAKGFKGAGIRDPLLNGS